uniref:Alkylated DNA repair protein AlkB homologue 8 N-terminal domain-containing protein n=1 Tax=Gasterosteus aculeatus aculeatus TaxID=481459 RepID=A0AAQ4P2L3_GASAC
MLSTWPSTTSSSIWTPQEPTRTRIRFVDFSSAFNTIIPSLLQDKLSTCKWITNILSDRKQHVKLASDHQHHQHFLPVHQQLHHQTVKRLKFVDDTTLIGLISGGDESAYRWESDHLVLWCSQNKAQLKDSGDSGCGFPEEQSPTSPVTIVDSFSFLGSIITQDLKWELNISSITKKAQQRLFFLRQLKKFNLPKTMMVHFYTAIIESILCSSITVWYAAATAKDKGRLERVIRSAERVIGCNLPSLQDLFASRSLKRAKKIVADPSHPGQKLFVPLPSGRRLQSIRTKTSRHMNSFFPSAVGLINRARSPTD